MLEVGEEEPDNMMTTWKSMHGDGSVDRVPRCYGPKGQRSGGAHVGGDGGEDFGEAAWTACRGDTTRRGDAAAARVSGCHGYGLGEAAWTACRDATSLRGDVAAACRSR